MIGVVVPAHNEAALVIDCIDAVVAAARHPDLGGEPVEIVVVLDACSDGTADIVASMPVSAIEVQVRNVGAARAQGAMRLLERGARWLAFTDADTQVAPDWLVQQLQLDAEVVCGTVAVNDWSEHAPHERRMEEHFRATYSDADGHRHVHGANLGISAAAYRLVGGFSALASSEDVALVQALQAAGVQVAWSAAPRVYTSARRRARAPSGFAAALCAAAEAFAIPAMAVK
ncbi:glycosyltransferase [Variovorax dokdonensis]|uniref:Glycosyltransferase n=1 Tax=Variovorax dokdonensis TaxID=344883 RepID=A0ABT7NDH8_9BURK|nr:glycosyltransferase [Variovorax dokdonensis]